MGFTLEATRKWSEILHPKKEQYGMVVTERIEKFPSAVPAALLGV